MVFVFQQAEAALLAETDIKVIVVGVGNVNIDELRAIASKPEYLYTINKFSELGNVYLMEQLCRGKWQRSTGLVIILFLQVL